MDKILADKILEEYEEISSVFSRFQNQTGLNCREQCGKCCFKKDIYCTPMEMLPLGLKLIKEKKAEEVLERCSTNLNERCILLKVTDEEKGFGYCTEYKYRPFICRSFGLAARKDKNGKAEFSSCKIIKEDHSLRFENLLKTEFSEDETPFIEQWRKHLDALDPRFLEEQFPVNKSLAVLLEKLLFLESLKA